VNGSGSYSAPSVDLHRAIIELAKTTQYSMSTYDHAVVEIQSDRLRSNRPLLNNRAMLIVLRSSASLAANYYPQGFRGLALRLSRALPDGPWLANGPRVNRTSTR